MRLLTYWAIVTLGPLLLGGSIALSSYFFALTEVVGIETFKGLAGSLLLSLPFLLSVVGFTLLYMVMPNRRVRWCVTGLGAPGGGLACVGRVPASSIFCPAPSSLHL